MSRDDWFRNEEWDAVTEARFNQKLGRARNKSQYLRVQAGYLAKSYPSAALALLNRYFALGDNFESAQAFFDQAEAYITMGALDDALRSLEKALQREREFPNFGTNAWSRYALLVAEKKLDHLYENALQVLRDARRRALVFPVQGFLWNAAFALIANDRGQRKDATASAVKALEYADLTHSGFSRHPDVGLVGANYNDLKAKLQQIATPSSSLIDKVKSFVSNKLPNNK